MFLSHKRRNPARNRKTRQFSLESLEQRTMMATLTPGGITTGTIDEVDEVDSLTFTGEKNQSIELVMRSSPLAGVFRAQAELYAPSGNRVTWFRFDAGDQRFSLPNEAGEYTLNVYDDYHDATGGYTIGFESLSPISPNPAALVKGGIVDGAIDEILEKDQYTFTAARNSVIELIMNSTPTEGTFRAQAELFAPSGNRVTGFRFDAGNQRISLPDEAGQYMLHVYDDYSDATGTYSIGLEGLRPISPNPLPLPMGEVTTQSIDRPTEKDQFTFTADALSKIELIMNSMPTEGTFRAQAELFAPSGNRVTWFRFDAGNQAIALPNESGTYLLHVYDDYCDATGTYSIGYEGIKPISPNPRALPRNATTSGEISALTEKDQFIFRGLHNETVQIDLTSIASDAGFMATAELYAPSGELIRGWRFDAGEQTITLNGGDANYMLMVRAGNFYTRGSYTVTLTGDSLPGPINTPTNLRAANVWHDKMDLNWNDASRNESGFEVAVSFDRGESWTTVGQTTANDQSFRVLGLQPGQSYKMKVRAFNDQAVSDYSNVVDVVTRLRPPSNFRATNITASSLRLLWADGNNNETGYQVFRRIGTGAWTRIATTAANVQALNVSGLSAGTSYQFRIRAINARTTSIFSTISVNTPSAAPSAAASLLAGDELDSARVRAIDAVWGVIGE